MEFIVFLWRFFTVTPLPPIKFAEPGRTWKAVTPPLNARAYWGSWTHMECSAHTSAVTGLVDSFPSELVETLGAA